MMTYYIVFCLATAIVMLIRCQWPVVNQIWPNRPNKYLGLLTSFLVVMLLAPMYFPILIFFPEKFMEHYASALLERKNNS